MSKLTSKIDYVGPSVLSDNEICLINDIFEIVKYSDDGYKAKIYRSDHDIIVHITPSDPQFKQAIIDNLLFINRTMKIKIRYSSSLKISKIISFRITNNSQ